jgi:hypothetical protein
MQDNTYNGWTNYATWRVNLEIFDDMEIVGMFDLTLDAYDLGPYLKDFAEMIIDNGSSTGLALDYAMAFLQDVNWREIAEHMVADYCEEGAE